MVITGLTRKIRFQRSERPRTFPTAQEILRDRIFTSSYRSCVFFLHSSGARITLEIYGELSERSKVRHSKCRVPKRNLGFESLTLRQKPSHIKAFAHMTGLFSQGHIGVHDFRQELRCASRSALCPAESGYCPLHLPR